MVVLYLFAHARSRRSVLTSSANDTFASRYSLYGLDDFRARGEHIFLDTIACQASVEECTFGKFVDAICSHLFFFLFGIRGGSWYKVLRMRRYIRQSDCIVTTADRVGIPLVILSCLRLLPGRRIVYISIGLPERLHSMRSVFLRLFLRAFQGVVAEIVCYGYKEYILLQQYFISGKPRVTFVPFGVDTSAFVLKSPSTEHDTVVCVGADPNRDFFSLFALAKKYQSIPFSVITSNAHRLRWRKRGVVIPANVTIQCDVPFEDMRKALSRAHFVVLPMYENSYSGATTTLLQAMSLGKAVIVTKTGAIMEGYHLKNNENVVFVPPEDIGALDAAFTHVFENSAFRNKLGSYARDTVVRYLDWRGYADTLYAIITHEGYIPR